MIAKTSIGEVYYTFQHRQYKKPMDVGNKKAKGDTACTIRIGQHIVSSRAYCSVEDNFDSERGRKLALARVMDKILLPKKVRREVWQAYLNRPRHDQKKAEVVVNG